MTTTEETLDEYAPAQVREEWARLAELLEERKDELGGLIHRLQAAYASAAIGGCRVSLQVGDLTNEQDDALRRSAGFERLSQAVMDSGLWPAVEQRDETPEEIDLFKRWMARRGSGLTGNRAADI